MKLHELIAVEGPLKKQSTATRTDLKNTFEKKRHHFEEKKSTFHPIEEGAEVVVEQQSDLQTHVMKELNWISGIWSKSIDASLQVADANQTAVADLVLEDGTLVLPRIPVTALLELEKRCTELQELLTAIPTLDPAKGFRADPVRGDHVFKARDVTKIRTKKTAKAITLAAATEHHPAQVQLINDDISTGKVVEQEWSGLITPAQKGELLERAEALSRAVKQARMRANSIEIAERRDLGMKIFRFVFDGSRNEKMGVKRPIAPPPPAPTAGSDDDTPF